MTGLRKLRGLLEELADADHYLFGPADLAPMFQECSRAALKMLFRRSVGDGFLLPVCRGVYLYKRAPWPRGLILYHAASKLRADTFNYISLESALSDAGIISQVPLQWLTLMSGGRSATIECGDFGTIEFIHTAKSPAQVADQVSHDARCGLWRASVALALLDMRACKRPLDLIDWSAVDESL
ncbi:MAG: type IV toxin-antitoxin system AbiEi family antitoxin [Rectinemataceae bacterium]